MAEQKNGGKNRKALIGIVAAVAAVVILVVVLLCVFVECEPAHTHTYGEWTTVKAATCEEAGERERTCPCGEKQTEVIPAAGHTPEGAVFENEKPATCKEDGSYEAVVYCAVCGEELSRTKMTTTAEHTPSAVAYENEKPAACETDGSCEMVVYCTVCGGELSREAVVLPATGHTRDVGKIENRTPATCEQDGSYEIVYDCKDCGKELRRALILLPAAGHTPAAEVRENEKPATCEANGSYDTVVYCADCGEELSRETVTIDSPGHDYIVSDPVTVDATCSTPGYIETVTTCSRCDYRETERTDTGYAAHDYGADNGDSCLVCGATNEKYFIFELNGDESGYVISENKDYTLLDDGSSLLPKELTLPASHNGKPVVAIKEGRFDTSEDRYITAFAGMMDGVTYATTKLVIPGTIERIGEYAFYYSMTLMDITFEEGVKEIGSHAFDMTMLYPENQGDPQFSYVHIPASMEKIGEAVFHCCEYLRGFTVAEGNKFFKTYGGSLIDIANKNLISCVNAEDIPTDGSVTSIEFFCLLYRTTPSVTIPEEITHLGPYAFSCFAPDYIDLYFERIDGWTITDEEGSETIVLTEDMFERDEETGLYLFTETDYLIGGIIFNRTPTA